MRGAPWAWIVVLGASGVAACTFAVSLDELDDGGSGGAGAGTGPGPGPGAGGATVQGPGGAAGQGGASSNGGQAGAGSGADAGAGGAGGVAGCQSLGDPCGDCVYASCQALYCGCFEVPDCILIIQCKSGCAPGEMDCLQACYTAHPEGISLSALLGDCSAAGCATRCMGVGPVLIPCELCLYESCASQMNTCLSDPDCAAIFNCVQQNCVPTDLNCGLDCAMQHPSGQGKALDLNSCLNSQCSADCS